MSLMALVLSRYLDFLVKILCVIDHLQLHCSDAQTTSLIARTPLSSPPFIKQPPIRLGRRLVAILQSVLNLAAEESLLLDQVHPMT